jgi:hypothetical protein
MWSRKPMSPPGRTATRLQLTPPYRGHFDLAASGTDCERVAPGTLGTSGVMTRAPPTRTTSSPT